MVILSNSYSIFLVLRLSKCLLPFFKRNKKDKLPKRFEELQHRTESFLERHKRQSLNVTPKEFKEILKKDFIPYLRSLGFIGSGNHYKRKTNCNYIHFISFRIVHRHWHLIRISYGVELDFLNKHKVGSIFDHYLLLPNGNYDFDLGHNLAENIETIEYINRAFDNQAIPFFERFKNFPDPLNKVSLAEVLNYNGIYKSFFLHRHPIFGEPNLSQNLFQLARIFCFIEDTTKVNNFANHLISILKTEEDTHIMISQLERIKKGDKNFSMTSEENKMEEERQEKVRRITDEIFKDWKK